VIRRQNRGTEGAPVRFRHTMCETCQARTHTCLKAKTMREHRLHAPISISIGVALWRINAATCLPN
jgi:hypothetical protein